jgi:hypothetical protein
MRAMSKTRPTIFGPPNLKPNPSRVALTESPSLADTPAAQAAAKAAVEARVRQVEAASLRGETLPDERYPEHG